MSFFRDLYAGETHIDFTKAWKRGLALSTVLVVVSVGALFTRGLNLGIDFEGGTVWQVPVGGEVSVAEARDALTPLGQGNAKIQLIGDETLSVQAGVDAEDQIGEITDTLADLAGVSPNDISIESVGPSWGDEITKEARKALIVFFALIALYITIQLEWKMAVGRAGRGRARHHRHRRRLRGVPVRGDPSDGDRHPDDPRLLAVRHHRGLRQGAGEHRPGVDLREDDLHRPGQSVDEPGAHPVARTPPSPRSCRSSRCCSSGPWPSAR